MRSGRGASVTASVYSGCEEGNLAWLLAVRLSAIATAFRVDRKYLTAYEVERLMDAV
jgi:hypothetical protein